MPNMRKSKSELRQVYIIRRTIAIIVLLVICLLVFFMCNRKKDSTTANSNNNTNTVTINPEENVNTKNNTENKEKETTNNLNASLNEVLLSNEKELQTQYQDYATVSYDSENKAFFFTFNDKTKDIVLQRESEEGKEAFKQFWENFKFELKKTSETLSENVEPGIELHVLNPVDNTSVLLLMQDGAEIFDQTSNQ